jgi:hypothetical protein
MTLIKKTLLTISVIIIVLTLFFLYVEYWFWHRTLTHEDKITIECIYYNPSCPNESRFYKINTVDHSEYSYLVNKYIEIICIENGKCELFNSSQHEGKVITISGFLYKDKNHTSVYDKNCEVNAFRFKAVQVKLK